jgi:hypothetical protein
MTKAKISVPIHPTGCEEGEDSCSRPSTITKEHLLRRILRGSIIAVTAGLAFTGATIEGGHQCGGCSQCLPPPATQKLKDEDDENEGNEDEKE